MEEVKEEKLETYFDNIDISKTPTIEDNTVEEITTSNTDETDNIKQIKEVIEEYPEVEVKTADIVNQISNMR